MWTSVFRNSMTSKYCHDKHQILFAWFETDFHSVSSRHYSCCLQTHLLCSVYNQRWHCFAINAMSWYSLLPSHILLAKVWPIFQIRFCVLLHEWSTSLPNWWTIDWQFGDDPWCSEFGSYWEQLCHQTTNVCGVNSHYSCWANNTTCL